MLATMATVTSGLLSPNSYGLTPVDQAAAAASDYRHHQMFTPTTPTTSNAAAPNSNNNSASDSDQDPSDYLTATRKTVDTSSNTATSDAQTTRRNKRKNFQPRCSNNNNNNNNTITGPLVQSFNNNNNNNTNRRKTNATVRRLVVSSSSSSALDLSKNLQMMVAARSTANNNSASSSSSAADSSDCEDEEDDRGGGGGGGGSFSIHNLSKPSASSSSLAVEEQQQVGQRQGQGHQVMMHHHQQQQQQQQQQVNVSDMREYAMNTMRELLGIYGLTSEVAESISRQLPMAAFSAGKIFENFTLSPTTPPSSTSRLNPHEDSSPPSQPPTPPSTPLSPKSDMSTTTTTPAVGVSGVPSKFNNNNNNSSLTTITNNNNTNNQTTSTITNSSPNIPQYHHSSSHHNFSTSTTNPLNNNSSGSAISSLIMQSMQHHQKSPLNLVGKSKVMGGDFCGEDGTSGKGSRGIFPPSFSHLHHQSNHLIKVESPPPFDHHHHHLNQSPLSAMLQLQQSTSTPNPAAAAAASLLLGNTANSSSATAKPTVQIDYSKYVRKFSSSLECGSSYCKDLNYREHFHCLDCNSRVFIKKEEMIRHFKWHKKRDESLQHGFMRYSPLDDCGDRYTNCTHNKKQTHYHCIKEGCDKVYISTSDVQMHANYHRKDSAIIQEGFQRYRATEECGASYCAFFGQRTTHFHCRRTGCRYTFKNKSDMEKHKSYHIKDEQLSRDGFKKFMKNEACPFDKCRFSKVCNHIHCIRPQCSYVLHSSGQLFSHKRKHERKDSELAYRKYKLAQSMMKTLQEGGGASSATSVRDYEQQLECLNLSMFSSHNSSSNMSNTESLSERNSPSPVSYGEESASGENAMDLTARETNNFMMSLAMQEEGWSSPNFWQKYCQFVGQQDCCGGGDKCELNFTDHYHCAMDNCDMVFSTKDSTREHARNHEQQELVTDTYYTTIMAGGAQNGGGGTPTCDDISCIYQDKEKHYHCNWDACREVILPTDKPFRRLEHYKMHEYSRKLSLTKDPLTMTHLATSIDGMFCRKRGRPPKNRVIEVWNDYTPMGGGQNLLDSPQAIFTSFKLPKPSATSNVGGGAVHSAQHAVKEEEQQDSSDDGSSTHSPTNDFGPILQGFDVFRDNHKCTDTLCPYLGSTHFHCNQNRCLYVTDKEDVLIMHSKDFHDNVEILDGFEFYDRNVDCRLSECPSNKTNRHFHCTRPDCNYSFVQYSTMALHNQKHVMQDSKQQDGGECVVKMEVDESDDKMAVNLSQAVGVDGVAKQQQDKVSVVKASGTFFPLSTLPTTTTTTERKSPTDICCKNVLATASDPTSSVADQSSTLLGNTGSTTLYGPELSCSRPFCKLKRKFHYHCNACNQAFSEMDRLVVHVAKHSTGALNSQLEDNNNSPPSNGATNKPEPKIQVAPLQSLQGVPSTDFLPSTPTFDAYSHFNFPSNLATHFALMSQQNFLPQTLYQNSLMFQHSQLMQTPGLLYPSSGAVPDTSPLAAMAANLNKRALSPDSATTTEQKKARIQNSMRILKDEPVPEGYLRFRFNEDCQYQHCGYREHQTHFHCQRPDCGYSFCDKTRFVQHTARHERLDTLMGGDFTQYRANVPCGRQDCAYTTNLGSTQNKASHFHCLKCEFVCTDTNKVVAHRRQHQKLDSIQAAGFEKFTPSQHCRVNNCQHSGKQTHYHCLQCQYAVLGLAQMSAHKYRHLEG